MNKFCPTPLCKNEFKRSERRAVQTAEDSGARPKCKTKDPDQIQRKRPKSQRPNRQGKTMEDNPARQGKTTQKKDSRRKNCPPSKFSNLKNLPGYGKGLGLRLRLGVRVKVKGKG